MRTIFIVLIAAVAAAAPAGAQSTTEFAIMHLNSDQDRANGRRMHSGQVYVVDPAQNRALQRSVNNFNQSAMNQNDLIGQYGVTVIPGPEYTGNRAALFTQQFFAIERQQNED